LGSVLEDWSKGKPPMSPQSETVSISLRQHSVKLELGVMEKMRGISLAVAIHEAYIVGGGL